MKNIVNEIKEVTWNPWHGCHKCSEGCRYCYVFEQDFNKGVNTNRVRLNRTSFRLPVQKLRNKSKKAEKYELQYKLESGTIVNVCDTSDFFLEEADVWRTEAWEFIHERKDCLFILNTRRPERVNQCLPFNWLDGWHNVILNISVANDEEAWFKISQAVECNVKHLWLSLSPMLEDMDIEPYLSGGLIEHVSISGESYRGYDGLSRLMELVWAKKIREQCDKYDVSFEFKRTGSRLKLLNGQVINIKPWDEKGLAEFYGLNNFEHNENWKATVEEMELRELAESAQRIYMKIGGNNSDL